MLRQKKFFLTIFSGLVLTLFVSGCGIIYTDVHVPRAYRSATPIDVQANSTDKVVNGESCSRSVLFLVAWGNAGYAEAVRDALKEEASGAILYDVQTDLKAQIYMIGLYTRTCTIVTGKVGHL